MLARRRFLALSAAGTAVVAVPFTGATAAAAASAPGPFASATWRPLVGTAVTAVDAAGRTTRLRVRGVVVDATTAAGEAFRVSLRSNAGPVADGMYAVTGTGLGRRVPVSLVGTGGSDAALVVNRTAR